MMNQRAGQGRQTRGLAGIDRPESCLQSQYTQIPSKEFYFLKKKRNLQVSLGGWSVLYILRMVLYIEENNNKVENVQFGPWNPKKPSSPQHNPQDGPQVVEQAPTPGPSGTAGVHGPVGKSQVRSCRVPPAPDSPQLPIPSCFSTG